MAVEHPGVAGIPGFGVGVAVIGIHQAAHCTFSKLARSGREGRQGVDAKPPKVRCRVAGGGAGSGRTCAEELSGSRNRVSSGERVHSLKYRRVRLLNHEQRNVLERLAVVETVTGTQDMLAATGKIVSEAYTRAEIRVVVVRNSSQRAADGL